LQTVNSKINYLRQVEISI